MENFYKRVADTKKALETTLNAHQERMILDTNYNKDGSKTKAPFFSIRGHLAETDQACTLQENYLAEMGDVKGLHVATDRIAFNGPKVPLNDQYRDIIISDLTKDITKSYQSKICRSPEASISAATQPKYIDAGVIPLVPDDHDPTHSTIGGINVGRKTVTSDPRTLADYNEKTNFYKNGGYIYNFGQDKMRRLHMNAVRAGAAEGAKAAFVHRAIGEVINYMTKTNDEPLNMLKVGSRMVASTIDGAVRSALVTDSLFSKSPEISRKIAEGSYSIAKKCLNYVIGKKNGTAKDISIADVMKVKGTNYISNIFNTVGANVGTKFGPVGVTIGSLIGKGIGNTINNIVSTVPLGKAAIEALGSSISINGILGGAAKTVQLASKATTAAAKTVTAGVSSLFSSIKTFALAHPALLGVGLLFSLLLLCDEGKSKDEYYCYQINQQKANILKEINNIYEECTNELSAKTKQDYNLLSQVYFNIGARQLIIMQRQEDEKKISEIEMLKKETEKQKEIIGKYKNMFSEMGKGLNPDNVFFAIADSIDMPINRFVRSKEILEMIG